MNLGSEFVVSLPAPAGASANTPAKSEMASITPGSKRRVLIVDDNSDAAESLAMLLDMTGWSVEVAFDGPAALNKFESFAPELVLLDIGMPGMDGYEVARRMRSSVHGQDALLVALTGWGQSEDKRRAAEAGFDDHLTKPVDPALIDGLLSTQRAAAPSEAVRADGAF